MEAMCDSEDVLAIWLRVTERHALTPELEDRFRQSEAAKGLALYLPHEEAMLERIGKDLRQLGTDGRYVLRIKQWLGRMQDALDVPHTVFIDDYESFVDSLVGDVTDDDERAREVEEQRRIGDFAGPDTPDDDLRFDTWWWPAPMPYEPPE